MPFKVLDDECYLELIGSTSRIWEDEVSDWLTNDKVVQPGKGRLLGICYYVVLHKEKGDKGMHLVLCWCWLIWYERNNIVFRSPPWQQLIWLVQHVKSLVSVAFSSSVLSFNYLLFFNVFLVSYFRRNNSLR